MHRRLLLLLVEIAALVILRIVYTVRRDRRKLPRGAQVRQINNQVVKRYAQLPAAPPVKTNFDPTLWAPKNTDPPDTPD